jgi:hypothetical protein
MTNAGVLVVGPSPRHVSLAVFSLYSLVSPLQYMEPVLVYTRLGDPRFADVIGGSTAWKIVGTTNVLALERCNQFQTVITVPARPVRADSEIRSILRERTKRLLGRFESALNEQLAHDPYTDFLGGKIPRQDVTGIGSKNPQGKQLTDDEADLFQWSGTFVHWQRAISMRDGLREALLSVSPQVVIAGRSFETLAIIEEALDRMISNFKDDRHVFAVLKRHRYYLRKEKEKFGTVVEVAQGQRA